MFTGVLAVRRFSESFVPKGGMLLRDINSPELLLLVIHRMETMLGRLEPQEQRSRSLTFAKEKVQYRNALVGFGSG